MFCAKCGQENTNDATFCSRCGAPLKEQQQSSASVPPTTPSYSVPPSTPSGTGKTASFKISSAINDAIALVKSPASFMNANREADVPVKTLMINYVAILALIPLVATLIGDSWFYLFLGGYVVGYSFVAAILEYVFDIIGVFVVGYIIWKLAPNFGTSTTQERATRLAAYIFTPAFLAGVFDLFPPIAFLTFLGLLYGLYIFYLGLPILMSTPRDKVLTYLIVTVILTIIVYVVIGAIIGAVTAAFFLLRFGIF